MSRIRCAKVEVLIEGRHGYADMNDSIRGKNATSKPSRQNASNARASTTQPPCLPLSVPYSLSMRRRPHAEECEVNLLTVPACWK